MNIFRTIRKTTRQIEPFHSQFFADALFASFNGDQELIRGFLALAVDRDPDKPLPKVLNIDAETAVDSGRIDITIGDPESGSIIGIEIKTSEASSTKGQLSRYQSGLESCNPDTVVRIVYLTPFNRAYSPDRASRSIAEFESFSSTHPEARHLSWLQVSSLEWEDGGDLWTQHQDYVREVICVDRQSSKRQLDSLFCPQSVIEFWSELDAAAPEHFDGEVRFSQVIDTERLVGAFRILVESSEPNNSRIYKNMIDDQLRIEYERSNFGSIHTKIFALTRVRWAWVDGIKRYGLRVPHADHSSGVSLCTVSSEGLEIPHS